MNKNIFTLLSIILVILLYPLVLRELISNTQKLSTEISDIENTLKKAEAFIEVRDSLIKRKSEFTQDELIKLEKILPKEINPIQLALDIEKLGERGGLILKASVDIDVPKSNKPTRRGTQNSSEDKSLSVDIVPIHINFLGEYENLENILEKLSESMPIFDVEGISFSGGETGVYDFSINLKTYQFKNSIE